MSENYCDECGDSPETILTDDCYWLCQECIKDKEDYLDFDEPEIDFDACDRESAAIHDFHLQERY